MIPILYEKDETAFVSNGLGRLRDITSATVTEERNGVYELDFEYNVNGAHFDELIPGRFVAVEHDDTGDVQPFEIVSYSEPIDGNVFFHCQHISYKQSKLTVSGTNINSLADAFEMLKGSTPANPFVYWTDKTSLGYMASADGVPRSVRSILGGVEGSILDTYGGEYEWDKYLVKLYRARGEQKDITIRYGVNLTDYTNEVDYADSYTAVIPYWTGDDGNGGTAIVKGSMISSGAASYDGATQCVPLDLSDKFQTQPTTAQLEDMASSLLSSQQPYLPAQTIKVNFVRLQDTEEYRRFAPLMSCKLCDTINVEFPRYKMSGRFKIVKTVYDVLRERYDEMELGTLSTSLSEALGVSGDSPLKETQGVRITDSGTSGIWSWRKWSDGTVECWGRTNTQSYVVTNPFVNGWYASLGSISFPSGLFTNAPTLQATRTNTGGGSALIFLSCYNLTASGFNGYVSATSSGTYDCQFSFYAIGK